MRDAYKKKLRFVDDPIDATLIPAECRDEYGVDAVALVRALDARNLRVCEMYSDARNEADDLTDKLEAKGRELKGMTSYSVEREMERNRLAEHLAAQCRSNWDMEQECWTCPLRRDPHDCNMVTVHDWIEWARWKDVGDEEEHSA